MNGLDGLHVLRRSECPTCGRVFTEGDGNVCRGPWALNQHEPAEWVRVEYVRSERLRGAVEGWERVGKLAAWIIRDRGERDKVTAYAGELEALVRRHGGQP